jgi:hypothetical protein
MVLKTQSLKLLSDAIADVCPIDGISVGEWFVPSTIRIDYALTATPLEIIAAQELLENWDEELETAKQTISNRRYEVEVSGISIEGQSISSERDEIGHWYPRFANAYGYINNDPFALAANPTGEYPYKPKNGAPVIFNASQVIRAYQCLSWYINTCFGVEKYLFDLLDADTPVANVLAAMDSAWPQREFTWTPPE